MIPTNPGQRQYGAGLHGLYGRACYALGFGLATIWKGLTAPMRKA